MIDRLCIVGVGLIGGSLARALKARGACREVVGCGRRVESLRAAVDLGVIDRYELDVAAAVADADVIVIAAPVGAFDGLFATIDGAAPPRAVITDVGSTKESVIRSARARLTRRLSRFVPGHPIAGGERTGVEASDATLFRGARVVLTPVVTTDRDAVDVVRDMWRATDAQIVEMSAAEHDRVLAATSHLPHVLAFTLVEWLARNGPDIFGFTGGGFRDFTRIAASDPSLWRDICMANRDALTQAIDSYAAALGRLGQAIREDDETFVASTFARARRARDGLKQSGETSYDHE